MSSQTDLPRSPFALALLAALWTIPGLLCAAQVYVQSHLVSGSSFSVATVLWYALPIWWVWVPVTPAICWLGRRFRVERGRLARSLLVHGVASTSFTALHIAFYAFWLGVAAPYEVPPSYGGRLAYLAGGLWVQIDLFVYGLVLGTCYAFDYYREMQERALRASRLDAERRRSELRALKARLHPHFLFNTLGAIQTHALKADPKRAADLIARLSDFLRMTLDEEGRQEVTLAEELEFARSYIAIEKERMGTGRLRVEVEVAPETLSARVPHLVLQPLAENAVRHGLAPKEGPGTLRIKACVEGDDQLRLVVRDDGVGLAEAHESNGHAEATASAGVGLSNIEARLRELHGPGGYDVQVAEPPEGGVEVTLSLPLRTTEEEAEQPDDIGWPVTNGAPEEEPPRRRASLPREEA